jgi:hypothetical protein
MMKVHASVAVLALAVAGGCDEQRSTVEQSVATTGVCMEDAAGFALNCTANDVRIAEATAITTVDGAPLDSCIEGTTFSFRATFLVDRSGGGSNFDIGLYFGTAGQGNARNGTCGVNVITPFDPLTGLGSTNFVQLDGAGDTCGDIDAAHDPQVVVVQVDDVLCKAGADGKLSLPACTSWRQSGSNGLCDGVEDAFPGSPSKCNCNDAFTVDIEVRPPSAAATKAFVELLCSEVRYSYTAVNTSDTQALTLTSLVDSAFGDLFAAHDDVLATTCAPVLIPVGGSSTCTFDARFCGGSHSNSITGTLDDGAGTVLTTVTNTVTVTAAATAN